MCIGREASAGWPGVHNHQLGEDMAEMVLRAHPPTVEGASIVWDPLGFRWRGAAEFIGEGCGE
jgi:hypothetical protein